MAVTPAVGDVVVFIPTDDAFEVVSVGDRVWMKWCADATRRLRSAALPLDPALWRAEP